LVSAGSNRKIRLKFKRAVLKKIRKAGGRRWKVRVTATATDGYGNAVSGKTHFSLIG
jgi:hypothetical protein